MGDHNNGYIVEAGHKGDQLPSFQLSFSCVHRNFDLVVVGSSESLEFDEQLAKSASAISK